MNKKTLTPIFLTVIFGLTISYIAYAWSEPSQSMPSSEVNPPINTGSDTQTKDGTLKINNGGGSVLVLESGGDIKLFNSNNSGSASLFCDNNDQLSTNGTINAQDGLCIGGDCKSSWEEVGSGSASGGGDTPIGTIMAWAKSLSGTPSIPTGWVECNGQVLNDSSSPYDGQTMPNLNSGTFLRGSTTSGGTGGSSTASTSLETVSRSSTRLTAYNAGYIYNKSSQGTYTSGIKQNTNSFSILPPYYNVVWIIKVKNTSGSGGSSGESLWQANGNNIYYNSGNVGIGTADPGIYKLYVDGLMATGDLTVGGGTGKINVGTIDPVFEIDEEKYATYAPDNVGGVRVETFGKIKLSKNTEFGSYCNQSNSEYNFVIDFDELEKGSDLWLFGKVTDFGTKMENLIVLLTPEGGMADLYYLFNVEENQLIIYGDKSISISYSLSAPRVDHQNWPNFVEDQTLKGIRVSDY